ADCPQTALFFEQVYANSLGIPQRRGRAACLFERDSGDIAWRHEGLSAVESRPASDLVLRTVGGLGNYDHVFEWSFQQNGRIKVAVGATGVDYIKAVAPHNLGEDRDGKAGTYGRSVAENSVAVDHDHFFCFRLDLDVDGTNNSFVREKITLEKQPEENPRRSVWVAKSEISQKENEAKLRISMEQPEIWHVVNPNVKSSMGYA